MNKLNYERKPPGKSGGGAGWFGSDSETRWPFICLGVGAGILLLAALAYGGISRCVPVFTALLFVTIAYAIADIVAGFVAALILKTDLGFFGIACLKLGAISVLCTALYAPFGFSRLGIFVVAPIHWILLMGFFDLEMFGAVVFTVASGILLMFISLMLNTAIG